MVQTPSGARWVARHGSTQSPTARAAEEGMPAARTAPKECNEALSWGINSENKYFIFLHLVSGQKA